MRKPSVYLVLGVGSATVCVVLAWLTVFREPGPLVDDILSAYQEDGQYTELTIDYPLDETLFPPDIVPPSFRWQDSTGVADTWLGLIEFTGGEGAIRFLRTTMEWTPSDGQWQTIKSRSVERMVNVTIIGVNRAAPKKIHSRGRISIGTSKDAVEAPLFYREVNLPFRDAVTDPAAHICWRFGTISSKEQPPVVLEKLPVCGNCHSFSADGTVLGLDVDYANEKGSYAIVPITEETVLDDSKIITWDDYKKEDGEHTFGVLSQISPDGRYVVSTVKDRSVFVPREDLAFSQLFFPIKGILVVYDRETGLFQHLPGADDKQFVQSNPSWSPDGKYLVFARQKAHQLKGGGNSQSVLLTREESREFLEEGKTFLFDLYRIPFNQGRGGRPEPLQGASHNGMSNYFPRYSPDGKWIVFCKAKSFMLLQPDSELYIIPAQGGKARRLRCNTRRMNSWHSWAPNGKWLVFSSKADSPYTQLFLTHIDDQGHSSPAVSLPHFTAPDRAANIPEFVNTPPGTIKNIRVEFLNDRSYFRAGFREMLGGDFDGAEQSFRKTLELNPKHVAAHFNLAVILLETGRRQESMKHCREALRFDPDCFEAHLNLGRALQHDGKTEEATVHLSEAVRLKPDNAPARYHLGLAMQAQGKPGQAVEHYNRAIEEWPDLVPPLLELASIRATSGYYNLRDPEEAIQLATKACELTRYQDPTALDTLAAAHASAGQFPEAVQCSERALQIADAIRDKDLVNAIRGRLALYRQRKPFVRSASP